MQRHGLWGLRASEIELDSSSNMVAKALVSFYRLCHGKFHLPGAGKLLVWVARHNRSLQAFRLSIPAIGDTPVDFRDVSAFYWLNYLLGDQSEERGVNVVILRYLRPGSTFWDVGANAGLISALVFASDPSIKIISIEPNPSLAARLRMLFTNHERILVLERGLSGFNGEASLFIPDGGSSVGTLEVRGDTHGKAMKVLLSRGDSLLDEFPKFAPPAVIKIDVEGHESAVFQGLSRIIRGHRPIIIFEHLFLPDEIIEQLTPPGYERFSIHDETGELIPRIERRFSHNSLLLPVDHGDQ
jgi:FkbM family methyltransferase